MNLIHKSQQNEYIVLGIMFRLDILENHELADFFDMIGAARAHVDDDHEYSFLKLYRSLKSSLSSQFFQRDYDLAAECDLDVLHSVKASWFVAKHPLKISLKQVIF